MELRLDLLVSMEQINPFDLLGVTPTSPVEDASRAFRELVLVVHPDKGGDDRQLHALVTAYRFVKEGLSAVAVSKQLGTGKTMAQLESEFAEFCRAAQPSLTEVDDEIKALISGDSVANGFDIHGFNRRFDADHGLLAPVPEGYGHLMLRHNRTTDEGPQDESVESEETIEPFYREIVVFKEPIPIPSGGGSEDMVPTHDYVNVFNATKEHLVEPELVPMDRLVECYMRETEARK